MCHKFDLFRLLVIYCLHSCITQKIVALIYEVQSPINIRDTRIKVHFATVVNHVMSHRSWFAFLPHKNRNPCASRRGLVEHTPRLVFKKHNYRCIQIRKIFELSVSFNNSIWKVYLVTHCFSYITLIIMLLGVKCTLNVGQNKQRVGLIR